MNIVLRYEQYAAHKGKVSYDVEVEIDGVRSGELDLYQEELDAFMQLLPDSNGIKWVEEVDDEDEDDV